MQRTVSFTVNSRPTHEQIVQHLEDNLCRCGSHVRVIEAVQQAAL